MLLGMTRKAAKMIAVLCIGIAFMLGVTCQLHASPHTHGAPAADHQNHHKDTAASSDLDDIACFAAVIPSVGEVLALPFLDYDIAPRAVKPLVPAFELDIPPRSAL